MRNAQDDLVLDDHPRDGGADRAGLRAEDAEHKRQPAEEAPWYH